MSDQIRVNGKRLQLPSSPGAEWQFERRPGGWVLASRRSEDGTVERRRLVALESKGQLSFHLNGRSFRADLVQKSYGGAAAGSDSDLSAQFPGKVRKVLVRQGQTVSEGEPLVMIEAMKMEFPVKAPFDGKVTKVLVQDGQQLSPGDRFVELGELAEKDEESGG